MTEHDYTVIPTAQQIQSLNVPKPEDYEAFYKATTQLIAKLLYESANALQSGRSVTFKFPAFRDGGLWQKLWVEYHKLFVDEIHSKGYWCGIDGKGTWEVSLRIALSEDPNRLQRNAGT